jgi:hypothetical protein
MSWESKSEALNLNLRSSEEQYAMKSSRLDDAH